MISKYLIVIWKEAVVLEFKLLSCLPDWTAENHVLAQNSQSKATIRTRDLPNTRQGRESLDRDIRCLVELHANTIYNGPI
jgi:hypothetical protein